MLRGQWSIGFIDSRKKAWSGYRRASTQGGHVAWMKNKWRRSIGRYAENRVMSECASTFGTAKLCQRGSGRNTEFNSASVNASACSATWTFVYGSRDRCWPKATRLD